MKGLANDNVNGSPMGKDRNDAVERDLKAMLRTDLLALRELAANMSKGIICQTRKIGLKCYRNVFLGEDAMQWLISHGSCIASTDSEAIEWGQRMVDAGFVKRVHRAHDNNPFGTIKVKRVFKGGKSMYQFDHVRISPFNLHIAVRRAVDLQHMDVFRRAPHPYVVLQLGEQQYAETKTVKYSRLSPVWSEIFVFGVSSMEAEQLRVSVYDFDSLMADRLIGFCQLGISDLPIFDENVSQRSMVSDDTGISVLDTSNSGDNGNTDGVVNVSKSTIWHKTRDVIKPRRGSNGSEHKAAATHAGTTIEVLGKNKCQSRYDNYATVEDDEEMSTDGLLDGHNIDEIDRSTSTCYSEQSQLAEDNGPPAGMNEIRNENSFTSRPVAHNVLDDTLTWLDLHGSGASGREKYYGKIGLELWLTSVKLQSLEAHGVIPIRISLQINSVTGVTSSEERPPFPLKKIHAKTRVVIRVGDEYSTSKYYKKFRDLRTDYGGEIISIEGGMNPTTDILRISVHQTTMDIGDKAIASVQIPLSSVLMVCNYSDEIPASVKASTFQLRALAGMLTARTMNNGELCASLWMKRCSAGDILGPEVLEDSEPIQGYDAPLPGQLKNLCIDKEISCGFLRLRRALLGQDSELVSLHDEECGIVDRVETEWLLPSGQQPASSHNLETCERQYSYVMNTTLWATKILCTASECVVVDTSVLCVWMVKTKTPEVPYGKLFTVKTQYMLARAGPNRVRICISSCLEFTQEPFVANQIRGAVIKGTKESFTQLMSIIEASLLPGQIRKRAQRKIACHNEFVWIHTACFVLVIAVTVYGMIFMWLPKTV